MVKVTENTLSPNTENFNEQVYKCSYWSGWWDIYCTILMCNLCLFYFCFNTCIWQLLLMPVLFDLFCCPVQILLTVKKGKWSKHETLSNISTIYRHRSTLTNLTYWETHYLLSSSAADISGYVLCRWLSWFKDLAFLGAACILGVTPLLFPCFDGHDSFALATAGTLWLDFLGGL